MFLRVMNGIVSHASNYVFKIGEVNVSEKWNINATTSEQQGGFNFTNEENILRWMIRGDTLYDVIIPIDAEIIQVKNKNTPNGVFRTNKIIVTNPREITDDMCLNFLKISQIPLKTYYQVLAIMAGKGFSKTCEKILFEKINKENVKECIEEYLNFDFYKDHGIYKSILRELYEI